MSSTRVGATMLSTSAGSRRSDDLAPEPVEKPVHPVGVGAANQLDLPAIRPTPQPEPAPRASLACTQGGQHLVGCDGQGVEPDPGGVVQRVQHGGSGEAGGKLADALRAVRPVVAVPLDQDRAHVGQVASSGHGVVDVGGVHHSPLLEQQLLPENGAEPHDRHRR